MDAAQALADLKEISSQVDVAVIVGADGAVVGATVDDERAKRIAEGAGRLLEGAGSGPAGREVAQLEAATAHGSVFAVREGGRTIVATTGPAPTSGLVLYDLKRCLASAEEPKPRPKRTRKKKADDAAA